MTPEQMIDQAAQQTGLTDFGDDDLFGGDTWREGLSRLVDSLTDDSRLNEIGVSVAEGEVTKALVNRLRVVDHHRTHPGIRDRDVTPPIVIIGQARTGTSMLFECLAQDPANRAPLTWEVDAPIPPPRTDTYLTDPRIAEGEATFELVDSLVPNFRAMHQLGASRPQECIRFTASTFMSVVFGSQFRLPGYHQWLTHDAVDSGAFESTYVWHRRFLEVLQSEHPGERWLVKTAAHCWTLDALVRQYPDALFVQTHRDPARVIASTASLIASLRTLASDEVDITDVTREWREYILDGLDRTVDARIDGTIPAERVADVSFYELMADPGGQVRQIYDTLGLPWADGLDHAVTGYLERNPREGSHDYTFDDIGLDLADVRAQTARYVDHFDVHTEV